MTTDNTPPIKCLIVDDDATNRALLTTMLAQYAECHSVENGEEAIVAFQSAFELDTPFELVCLDIMMPNLDGHAVLKAIREFEHQQGVPIGAASKVLVLSALEDSQNVFQALTEGSESYLVKPIDQEDLLREIRKLGLIS